VFQVSLGYLPVSRDNNTARCSSIMEESQVARIRKLTLKL